MHGTKRRRSALQPERPLYFPCVNNITTNTISKLLITVNQHHEDAAVLLAAFVVFGFPEGIAGFFRGGGGALEAGSRVGDDLVVALVYTRQAGAHRVEVSSAGVRACGREQVGFASWFRKLVS